MAFICRKPFTFKGTKYRPGDAVKGFPEDFFRPEGFIRTGMIVERPDVTEFAPAPKLAAKKKSQPKVEVEAPAEESEVVEEVLVEVTEE